MKNRFWTLVAIGLVCAFCLQAFLAIPRLSATIDEPVHLSAGYSYWQTRDFRLNPEHPPLVKLLASLPLLVLNPKFDTSSNDWRTSSEYPFGLAFLYGNDADRFLFWGRVPVILLAAFGGVIAFLWARDLFGPAAGAFAAAFYCFCPNLLAHGTLITTDVPLGTFTLLTLYLFWRQRDWTNWRSSIMIGLALGAAMSSKYSGALLPILLVGLTGFLMLRRKNPRNVLRGGIQNLAIIAAASLLVIEITYLFSAPPTLYFQNATLVNANHDPNYESYMMGELKQGGWWYYFLVAFVVKATLPALVLILLATVKTFSGFADIRAETILLATIVMYFVAISAGADNIGIRYLAPVFPLIYVWGSKIVPSFSRTRAGQAVLGLLVLWQIGAAVSSFPNYIPYFNEAAGGPRKGPDLLDDSNVDWGQSLKQAAAYVKENQVQNVVLSPFSEFENPGYYGLPPTVIAPKQLVSKTPDPGTYIISSHNIAWMKTVDAAWRRYQPVARVGGMWVYRF